MAAARALLTAVLLLATALVAVLGFSSTSVFAAEGENVTDIDVPANETVLVSNKTGPVEQPVTDADYAQLADQYNVSPNGPNTITKKTQDTQSVESLTDTGRKTRTRTTTAWTISGPADQTAPANEQSNDQENPNNTLNPLLLVPVATAVVTPLVAVPVVVATAIPAATLGALAAAVPAALAAKPLVDAGKLAVAIPAVLAAKPLVDAGKLAVAAVPALTLGRLALGDLGAKHALADPTLNIGGPIARTLKGFAFPLTEIAKDHVEDLALAGLSAAVPAAVLAGPLVAIPVVVSLAIPAVLTAPLVAIPVAVAALAIPAVLAVPLLAISAIVGTQIARYILNTPLRVFGLLHILNTPLRVWGLLHILNTPLRVLVRLHILNTPLRVLARLHILNTPLRVWGLLHILNTPLRVLVRLHILNTPLRVLARLHILNTPLRVFGLLHILNTPLRVWGLLHILNTPLRVFGLLHILNTPLRILGFLHILNTPLRMLHFLNTPFRLITIHILTAPLRLLALVPKGWFDVLVRDPIILLTLIPLSVLSSGIEIIVSMPNYLFIAITRTIIYNLMGFAAVDIMNSIMGGPFWGWVFTWEETALIFLDSLIKVIKHIHILPRPSDISKLLIVDDILADILLLA